MYLQRNGWSEEGIRSNRMEDTLDIGEISERDKETQIQGQKSRVVHYKQIRPNKEPTYLKKEWKKENVKTIARFRCGSEERSRKFWRSEEEKRCRLCGKKEETMEECDFLRRPGRRLEELLG